MVVDSVDVHEQVKARLREKVRQVDAQICSRLRDALALFDSLDSEHV